MTVVCDAGASVCLRMSVNACRVTAAGGFSDFERHRHQLQKLKDLQRLPRKLKIAVSAQKHDTKIQHVNVPDLSGSGSRRPSAFEA
jgi:hypothetical protein